MANDPELDELDAKIARIKGWRYLKGPTESAGMFWFDREQTQARKTMPSYTRDPVFSLPLIEDEIVYAQRVNFTEWGVRIKNYDYHTIGHTLAVAGCYAIVAREEA